jgi:hypothetical protein
LEVAPLGQQKTIIFHPSAVPAVAPLLEAIQLCPFSSISLFTGPEYFLQLMYVLLQSTGFSPATSQRERFAGEGWNVIKYPV